MIMTVIDATNLILGRMATNVAERLLKGETIDIINVDKAVVSGKKEVVVGKFLRRVNLRNKGNPYRGPKFPRHCDRLVRKSITGMLPDKTWRGREAMHKLKCFEGVPEQFQKAKLETIQKAENHLHTNFVTILEISEALGVKREL